MALTDEEQRLLDVLEASLKSEDPKLARDLDAPERAGLPATGRLVGAGVAVVVGVLLLIAGMSFAWWLCVVGFLAMLVGVTFALAGIGRK
ncbi:MAG: DUF3040 domain-containing protein [Propionibacteriaceae bacterium]|jgi:hypothetical protein|nr:DUF3040 domain-containing protein [Propionibacteriaceae bacterium]